MPDRWLNCRAVLTICSKKTTACGLVWKANGSKMHEEIATLHPQLNKIKARSLSGQTTTTLQRMTSSLPTTPCFQIYHLQRTMWRPNQGRDLHVVPIGPSAACLVGCGENSAEKDGSRSTLLKTCPRGKGVQYHHFHSGIPLSELHQPHICLHLLLSGDLRTCCRPH